MNSETKTCQNCKQNFVIEPDDFGFYEKMGVPAPKMCPDCRFKRRAVFRNEITLYKNNCKLCNSSVITMYNPKSPYTVYCNDCWASDKWDPFSYAMDYDFSRPFFDQLKELSLKVPKAATYAISIAGAPNINSEYTNFAGGNKDCYLISNSGPNNENCAYGRGLMNNRDAFDVYYATGIEKVYEGINVNKSNSVVWGQNLVDCLDSWFVLNCVGCHKCFGCVNLRHKSYCFLNEQLIKEEWEKRISEITGSYSALENFRKKFEEFSLKFPRRENTNFKSVNCTGDYIVESKNCHDCFEVSFQEDSKYCFSMKKTKDSFDCLGHGRDSSLLYEVVGVGYSSRIIGSWWANYSQDVEYCLAVRACQNCFGCEGVRNAKFSILNKRYEEAKYKKIRSHIIEELKNKNLYGLFIPPELSFFAYNESISQDNIPLTKEEVLKQGFRWEDDISRTRGQETIQPEEIPDHIKDAPDGIVKEVLRCVECGYNYRLIQPELDFYRKMLIPIPRKCFYCRHADRLRRRGLFKLYSRTCAKCGKEIHTTYAPERPEIVYCEACYQKEVV